jgi:hypothetical protein
MYGAATYVPTVDGTPIQTHAGRRENAVTQPIGISAVTDEATNAMTGSAIAQCWPSTEQM